MKYCKRCLYPLNHPYGLILDDKGVCSGCRVHEEKDELNWDIRFEKLKSIVYENSKQIDGRGFDCIVPITGGGDSYFIVHTVKHVLGMNPLLVHYNHHYNTRVGIRNLANISTVFDCDVVTSTLSPGLLKRITRHTLKKYGSMYWQVLSGGLTFPVQVAVKFKIPLIIWGVHPWSEQTGMFSHIDEVEMTERCRKEHGLMGIAAEDVICSESNISRADVQPFVYPYDNEIEAIGVRGLYLSNYLRWDAKAQHEEMINLYGYETAGQIRTFNTYEDVHCAHSAGIHDYIKYLKYGYSKVTDHASREIRLRRLTREEGIKWVEAYTNNFPGDLSIFLDWVEMKESEFWSMVVDRRDPKIWQKTDKEWHIKDSISNHLYDDGVDEARLQTLEDCEYQLTESNESENYSEGYTLMGRVYLDQYNYGSIEDRPPNGVFTSRQWKMPSII